MNQEAVESDGTGRPAAGEATVPHRTNVERFAAEGEGLLYNPDRDEASALNRSAMEIWELCDGRRTVRAIARVLGERYQVDEAMFVEEILATIAALQARGLVAFGSDASRTSSSGLTGSSGDPTWSGSSAPKA
jgi:hypothetical protein